MVITRLFMYIGIAKEFVVPGWRVGWLVIHDKGTGRLAELAGGIKSLTQLILGTLTDRLYCIYPTQLVSLFIVTCISCLLNILLQCSCIYMECRCKFVNSRHTSAYPMPHPRQRRRAVPDCIQPEIRRYPAR